MRGALRAVGLLGWLSLALTALRAHAQPSGSALDDGCVSERLARVEAALQQDAVPARLWWYGWLGYSAIEGTVGAVAYARSHDRLNRDVWLVTWVGSAAFMAELLVFPMVPAYASRKLARLPRGDGTERRRALAEAERLLARSARVEWEGVSPWSHVLGAAWAAGTGAYLVARNLRTHAGLGSRHNRAVLRDATLEMLWSVAITELAIWTQPLGSARAARELLLPNAGARARRELSIRVLPAGGSLQLAF